jgi:response regulator NasT
MDVQLRVLLASEGALQTMFIESAIAAAGHAVVAQCGPGQEVLRALRASKVDLVIVQVQSVSRCLLDALERIYRDLPHPVLLVAAHGDGASIRRAMRVGVSTHVAGELLGQRLGTIIEVCLMQFQMQEALRNDLKAVSEQLADARDVERAKGVLMKRRQVDEEQALNTLQSMANDRGQRLGDFARSLLAVAEAL